MIHPLDIALVAGALFIAAFTQSVAGFGTALIAMPILCPLVGVRTAAPLTTLVGILMQTILLVRYRGHVSLREVWPLAAASLAGIPLGILGLRHVRPEVMVTALGVVVLGYALYALATPRMPRIGHAAWALPFGFVSGLLGGAYNTDGPPAVVYGTCRGWTPAAFKAHLQGFFLFNALLVVAGHVVSGNLTAPVWRLYLYSLPAIGLGALAGLSLDKRLNPALFRKVLLGLLVVLGLRLALTAVW